MAFAVNFKYEIFIYDYTAATYILCYITSIYITSIYISYCTNLCMSYMQTNRDQAYLIYWI